MARLDGKAALVTGSSRGIGRGIAQHLARDGAAVMVTYSTAAKEADEVVSGISMAGGHAVAIQANLGSLAEVRALFEEVDRSFGKLDILVNNAAMAVLKPLNELDEQTFDAICSVNSKGVLFACQEAAKRLGAGGRIVNISSSTAHFPLSGSAVYAGTKAAIEMYTKVLAKELGPKGVTVNAVAPGPTLPGSFEYASHEVQKAAIQASPFGRLGCPDDIAAVVAFLASEEARWVTGQTIVVNGGASV